MSFANQTNATTIDLRVLDERIRDLLPAYATSGAAGMDLRACVDGPLTIAPGDTLRESYPRSRSLAARNRCGLALALCI